MAEPERTQKQIAQRYQGNLSYTSKTHPWRLARWIASLIALAGGTAAIIAFEDYGSQEFFSSGKISSNHAALAHDCGKCHERSSALSDPPTFSTIRSVVSDRFRNGIDFASIDLKCEKCHQHHSLHEPNVIDNRSCSVCHQEHLGPGRMTPVKDKDCLSCHNNSSIMEASAEKGAQLPPTAFRLVRSRLHPPQQVVFELPRPPRGYTQVLSSFSGNHPEFQLIREKARDPDVLRFNHQRHFANDIPPVAKDRRLDCNYCHKPDPEGRFYQRISFAANCQACHALLFDRYNPDLHVPHGDVNLVRTFLRTLPAQFGDHARSRGITGTKNTQDFVAQQIKRLKEQFYSGEELERAVFFEKNPYRPVREMGPATRANYVGCALCHEVKPDPIAVAAVTKPILIDRWMPQARFNHAKHQIDPVTSRTLDCNRCHRAQQSHETSDVIMPARADCVTCHSPRGKVASNCITCHGYHSPQQSQTAPSDIVRK